MINPLSRGPNEPPPAGETVEIHEWFHTHVLPHEGMLRAWLRSQFRDEKDVDEVVQESFARLIQIENRAEIHSPKAFLFATARNLAIGRLRKANRHGEISMADCDVMNVLIESEDVATSVAHSEELEFLAEAIQSLPARCRQVITLRKIYGMSQKEVARELGISENTVESQGAIGMRKLTEYFERLDLR